MRRPNAVQRMMCRLGLCSGHVEHFKDANGVWWIGLKCTATGRVHHPVKSKFQDLDNPPLPVVYEVEE